jgi:hypothetical protein
VSSRLFGTTSCGWTPEATYPWYTPRRSRWSHALRSEIPLASDRSVAYSPRWSEDASRLLAFLAPFQKPCYGMASGGRMEVLIAALATVVATLGIILFSVHKTRPKLLRLKVSLTRWLTLSLEIEQPQRSHRGSPDGR